MPTQVYYSHINTFADATTNTDDDDGNDNADTVIISVPFLSTKKTKNKTDQVTKL